MADAPIIKAIVLIVFALIVISLGSAFFSLFRRRKPGSTEDDAAQDDNSTVKALTVRVVLSIGLVLALIILNALGIIEPNG